MIVLVVSNDYPPIRGGISAVAENCVACLKKGGNEVVAVVPRKSLETAIDACDAAIGYWGYERIWTRFPSVIFCLIFGLLRWRPDAVLALNVSYAGPVLAFFPKPWRPRMILAAFGLEFLKWPHSTLFQGMVRWMYGRADAVLTVSRHMTDRLISRGIDQGKIRVLHVHVKLREVPEESDARRLQETTCSGSPLLLTVARLVHRKGIDLVLHALPAVLKSCPGAMYWVVGEGPERSKLEKLARDLGISERVVFMGECSSQEVAVAYEMADLFVMTPRTNEASGDVEGLGLTYVEAALAGLPCVGSLSGGVPEAIEHGVSGWLIPEEDSNALAEAVIEILQDPDLCSRMGQQGKARAQRLFSSENMQNDLEFLLGKER